LTHYVQSAEAAHQVQLGVNAGHDLNRDNLPLFLSQVPQVLEVSIGHALVADALEMGYTQTVQAYLQACRPGAQR
jgi:pyridoxine 5-phosphate synthase